MTDLGPIIDTAAQKPKSVTTDGTKVDAHSLDELIKADQHLKGSEGVSNTTHRGLRFSKLCPPGTTS